MTDIIDEMAAASVTVRGDFIRDGKGRLLIRKVLHKNLNDGPTFIVEAEVLESASKGDVDPVTKQPVSPNAPGSIVSYVQKLLKHKQTAVPNAKAFVCAVLGVDSATVPHADFREAFNQMTGDKQAAAGMVVDFSTYQQETKSTKKVNTYTRFNHVSPTNGNSEKEINARRAKLS